MGELKHIALDAIRPNPISLRSVDTEDEGFEGLVASIRAQGVMNAISVRPKKDEDTGEEYFELVDGLHRYTASKEAGLAEIPAQVMALDDAAVLEAQIIGNVQKIETKPAEYTKGLRKVLNMNPMMTMGELAAKVGKSEQWISQRLSLLKIENESIQQLINDGQIKLTNAYALAKLPPEEQVDYCERAQTQDPQEFIPSVNERIKEIRDAKRAGKDAAPPEYVPTARLQKIAVLKDEIENGAVATELLSKTGVTDPKEVFALAIQWATHLDPISVEVGREQWEAKQAEKKAKAEARKKAREEEKARKAKENQEKVEAEAAAN